MAQRRGVPQSMEMPQEQRSEETPRKVSLWEVPERGERFPQRVDPREVVPTEVAH